MNSDVIKQEPVEMITLDRKSQNKIGKSEATFLPVSPSTSSSSSSKNAYYSSQKNKDRVKRNQKLNNFKLSSRQKKKLYFAKRSHNNQTEKMSQRKISSFIPSENNYNHSFNKNYNNNNNNFNNYNTSNIMNNMNNLNTNNDMNNVFLMNQLNNNQFLFQFAQEFANHFSKKFFENFNEFLFDFFTKNKLNKY